MIDPLPEQLSDDRPWLRVADVSWDDPLDPSFAEQHGGRWNPPGSFPTLYLNEDIETARAQVRRMLDGWPIEAEDLDPPFVLVTLRLPGRQIAADATTDKGLSRLGLPATYPIDAAGAEVPKELCQPIGVAVKLVGMRGVHSRSAATPDGSGRELAWFPARRSSKARRIGTDQSFNDWWYPKPGN